MRRAHAGRSGRAGLAPAHREEDIPAVKAAHSKVYVALRYQNRCRAVLEKRIPLRDANVELADVWTLLDNFRLGLRGEDDLLRHDGPLCRLPHLPVEAQGFGHMCVIGSRARLFQGLGTVLSVAGNSVIPCGKGMPYGYDRLPAARQ